MSYEESTDDVINANVDFRNVDYQIFTLVQMARILGGCAPALDYSQEAKKLWAKLGETEEKDVFSWKIGSLSQTSKVKFFVQLSHWHYHVNII